MSLLLLPGGDDQRRARIERREQGAHRVAEPRRDMHVARDQFPRGTGVPVGHRDDDRLLQAEHVAHVRVIGERMHDRHSVVPGLPKRWVMPSDSSNSINALRPLIVFGVEGDVI